MINFVKQLINIALFPGRAWDELRKAINFGIIGVIGVAVNMVALTILKNYISLIGASFIAIELAIISNFILNDMWTFKEINNGTWLHRMFSFNAVSVGSMIINIVTLAILTMLGVWYVVANLIGIIIGFGWNFIMNRKTTWKV